MTVKAKGVADEGKKQSIESHRQNPKTYPHSVDRKKLAKPTTKE